MCKHVIVWAMLHDSQCSFCLQVAMALAAIVLLAAGAAAQPFQPGTGFAPLGMSLLCCNLPELGFHSVHKASSAPMVPLFQCLW